MSEQRFEIGIAYGEIDGECRLCDECFPIVGVLVQLDGREVCPNCLPAPLAQIVRALDAIYDAAVFDLGPGPAARTTADALRLMGDLVARLDSGERVVHRRVNVVREPWAAGDLAGIQLDWRIIKASDEA